MIKILKTQKSFFSTALVVDQREEAMSYYRKLCSYEIDKPPYWLDPINSCLCNSEFSFCRGEAVDDLLSSNMIFFSTTSVHKFRSYPNAPFRSQYPAYLKGALSSVDLDLKFSKEFAKFNLMPIIYRFYEMEMIDFVYFAVQKEAALYEPKEDTFTVKWLFAIRPITGLDNGRLLENYQKFYFSSEDPWVFRVINWTKLIHLRTSTEINSYFDIDLVSDIDEDNGGWLELAHRHGFFQFENEPTIEPTPPKRYSGLNYRDSNRRRGRWNSVAYDPVVERSNYPTFLVSPIDFEPPFSVFNPPPLIPLPAHPHRVIRSIGEAEFEIKENSYEDYFVLLKFIKTYCQLESIVYDEGLYYKELPSYFKLLGDYRWFEENFFLTIWPTLCREFPASTVGLSSNKLFLEQMENLIKIIRVNPVSFERESLLLNEETLTRIIDERKSPYCLLLDSLLD